VLSRPFKIVYVFNRPINKYTIRVF
jgi:CBS domain containing-hemolysin-like protein